MEYKSPVLSSHYLYIILKMPSSARILLGCDKTRGHLNPALCFARALKTKQPPENIYFYPITPQWEALLSREGFSYTGQRINMLRGPLETILRLAEALRIVFSVRPRYAIGYGGRRSMWTIWLLSWFIPTAIYEPNASFGKANFFLAFFVKKIFTGFPDIAVRNPLLKKLLQKKMTFTGIPLKEDFFLRNNDTKERIKESLCIPAGSKVLLAFGGSSGAAFLNHMVYSFFTREGSELSDVFLIHLTGAREYEKYRRLYANHDSVIVKDFSENMHSYYRIADALISRAGASSIAETAFFKIPSVIIPLPGAYAHQYVNAEYLSERKGSILFSQNSLDYMDFKKKVRLILFDSKTREYMQSQLTSIKIWSTPERFARCIEKNLLLQDTALLN